MSESIPDEGEFMELMRDKKKQKKWRKRVEKGEANHREAYLIARYLCHLDAIPSIDFRVDRSRQKAGHDLQISEVRDLLSCVLLDQPSAVRGFSLLTSRLSASSWATRPICAMSCYCMWKVFVTAESSSTVRPTIHLSHATATKV
eukprot:scaffold3625_cov179-Ochromonas_danica.AAC.5